MIKGPNVPIEERTVMRRSVELFLDIKNRDYLKIRVIQKNYW